MHAFDLGHPAKERPLLRVRVKRGADAQVVLFEKFENENGVMDHKQWSYSGSAGEVSLAEGKEIAIGDPPNAVSLSLSESWLDAMGEGTYALSLQIEGMYSYLHDCLDPNSQLIVL